MLSLIIGVLFLLADQFIKYWTVSNIELNTGIRELFPGILHLTYIRNYGAAFGVLSNVPWLRWVLLGLLVCFTLFILLGIRRGGYLRTGFARFTGVMLLAGLLGNGIDRAIYGYVVDMFELEFINFAIFNLADVLAVFFGILFCIALVAGGIGAPVKASGSRRPASRSSGSQAQRSHRSSSGSQAQRSHRSSSGSQAQRSHRPSSDGHPRRTEAEAEAAQERPARPRPASSGMSVRPLVSPEVSAESPAQPDVPAEEAPAETPVPAEETTAPAADATRPFQPVSRNEEVPASTDATRPYRPVNEAEPAVKSGDTLTYEPAPKAPVEPEVKAGDTLTYEPAAKPAARPAAKSADEFELDSILSEFK